MYREIKRVVVVAAICIFCQLFSACAFFAGDIRDNAKLGEDEIEQDYTVVGFSQPGAESAWRVGLTESVKTAFDESNGYKLIYRDGQSKQDNQIRDIRTFIQQGVDYIILSPIVETGWDQVLEECRAAGIPVIICDRGVVVSNESLYTAYVGSNFTEEGILAIDYLEKYHGERMLSSAMPNPEDSQGESTSEPLNIVHIQGTLGSSSQVGRSKPLLMAVEEKEEWNIIAEECGDFTKGKAREVMTNILNEIDGNDIDVVYCENDDEALGVMAALNEAGLSYGVNGDIAIVSFDGSAAALEMCKNGLINFEVECNPRQGQYLYKIVEGLKEKKSVPKITYIDERAFSPEDVSQEMIEAREY